MAGVFGDSGRPPAGTIEDSGNAGRPPAGTIGDSGNSGRPPARTIEDSGNVGRPPARVTEHSDDVGRRPARHMRKPYHSKEGLQTRANRTTGNPDSPPEKTWCIFFFDEVPHFCHIMRQGGRVTVANGTQGIRLNG